jgi:hypothetical protein
MLTLLVSIIACRSTKVISTCYEYWRITKKESQLTTVMPCKIRGNIKIDPSNTIYGYPLHIKVLTSRKQFTYIVTDEHGNFQVSLNPGAYKMAITTNEQTIEIPNIVLVENEELTIELEIGSVFCIE